MGCIYGYVRVSSRDQNEDRQLIALEEVGILRKNIYVDKQSGKDFDRPAYQEMLRRLGRDDLLYGELSNQVQRPLIENFIGSLKAKAFTWTHV